MSDDVDQILKLLADKSSVRLRVGQMVAAGAAVYTIQIGTSQFPALPTGYLPDLGENVWVAIIDGQPYVLGPTVTKPDRGTVVSVSSGLVTLNAYAGATNLGFTVAVPYTGATAPTAGQLWKIVWAGGGVAIGPMSVTPAGGTAPVGGGGATSQHVDVFTALDAGSYQSRWWQAEVYASDGNLGAWFYGSKLSDTLPSAASIGKIELYCSMKQVYGSAPNFALHGYQSKPAGSPTLTSPTAVPVADGAWVTLPTAFGTALRAGGGSAGVGVSHGGYNIFRSLAEDGSSGALRITSTY